MPSIQADRSIMNRTSVRRISMAILGILVGSLIALYVQGLLTVQRQIPGKGRVVAVNLQIYWDAGCTQIVSEIDWGQLRPGDTATKSVFAKNTGDVSINLSLSTGNWTPSTASSYISLSWNYTGALVQPNQTIPVKLLLTVSWSISGISEFSFDILVTAVEV